MIIRNKDIKKHMINIHNIILDNNLPNPYKIDIYKCLQLWKDEYEHDMTVSVDKYNLSLLEQINMVYDANYSNSRHVFNLGYTDYNADFLYRIFVGKTMLLANYIYSYIRNIQNNYIV